MDTGMSDQQSNLRHVAVYGKFKRKSRRYELQLEDTPQNREALKLAIEHPPKNRFVRNVVLGDWDRNIVKVELDKKYFLRQVKAIAEMLMKRYFLEGYVILLSSNSTERVWDKDYEKIVFKRKIANYHIVFDKLVSWSKFISILAWLSLRLKDPDFDLWFKMQCVKQTCTLRHSGKGKKKRPKIVYCFGRQEKGIKMFLANRRFIHSFLEVKQE